MKSLATFAIIVMLLCLCAAVWAAAPTVGEVNGDLTTITVAQADTGDTEVSSIPKPKSTGFSFGPNGVSLTYLHDGDNYGLAAGAEIGRKDKMVAQGWLVFEPVNKSQVGLGATLGYDITLVKDTLILTPLVGVMQPVTEGLDGKMNGKFVYGGSLTARF